MLTVGTSIVLFQQASIVKPKMTLEEAHDECPCKGVGEKLRDYLITYGGLDDFDFSQIPEYDEDLMRSGICGEDGEAARLAIVEALPTGCPGFGFNYNSAGSSQSNQQSQASPSYGERILFSMPTNYPLEKENVEMNGYWEITSVDLSYETMIARLDAIEEYFCGSGAEPDPEVYGPGDWTMGRAIAFCAGLVGAIFGAPHYIISGIIHSLWMLGCLDLMAYSLMAHWLDTVDLTIYKLFVACVEFLTGQPFP